MSPEDAARLGARLGLRLVELGVWAASHGAWWLRHQLKERGAPRWT